MFYLMQLLACFSLINLYVGINVQAGPICASGLRKSSAVICPGLQPQLRFVCHFTSLNSHESG